MEMDKELIHKLLTHYNGSEELIGEQGLLKKLTKALIERAMHSELTHRPGYRSTNTSSRPRTSSVAQKKISFATLKLERACRPGHSEVGRPQNPVRLKSRSLGGNWIAEILSEGAKGELIVYCR